MQSIVKTLKNNERITISFKENSYNYKSFTAFNNKNQEIGSITFVFSGKTCWISRIEVTDINYSRIGLGSILLNLTEKFAIKNGKRNMDGTFRPFGELGWFAKSFYEKNGYQIYKDGYETYISKYLNFTKQTEQEL